MSDDELDYGSDREVSENHGKLIEAVSKLDKGQRVKKPQRSEPSLHVSEFHLVKSGIADSDAVLIDDLAKTLGSKGHHAEIGQKLRATQKKSSVLPRPLEKPAADKLKRIVGFENTKKELRAWNAIVARNRAAEALTFPLHQSTKAVTSDRFVERFRLQSDLEKELAALEPPKPKPEEKEDEYPLTLEEIMRRRKEAARFRAQQSYREAKAHRQNKIKSKKFHRIQRKAKIKQQLKDFETLQKNDPQAALEKLEELDKTRAEERMSLRHKSTGQWAKNKQVRAKYNKESRQLLAEQLSISKALTQKARNNEDSDEDEMEAMESLQASEKDESWSQGLKTSSEIDDFVSGYRKYWDEHNRALKEKNLTTVDENRDRESRDRPKVVEAKDNPVESYVEEYEETKENTKSPRKKKIQDKATKNQISTAKKRKNREIEKTTDAKISKKMAESPCKRSRRKKCEVKKAGTSDWYVEPVKGEEDVAGRKVNGKPLSIDDLFETMEDRMIRGIDTRLKRVKKRLKVNAVAYKKYESSVKRSNEGRTTDSSDLSLKRQKIRPEIDEAMDENTGISGNKAARSNSRDDAIIANGVGEKTSTMQNCEIDPNKFITIKPKHLKTQLPDTITGGDEALDDSDDDDVEQRKLISEAFEDDDVVEEFRKEKAEEIKKSQAEEIDLRLPGWGSWGGKNIGKSMRKKHRFVLKFPKEVKRRDENKGDVIIIEEKDPKIRQHQVSDLPYPFNSVKDFESSIRAPIGRNFVPENAHKRFTRPAVKTKMGKIIEPMDAEALVRKKPRKRTHGLKKEKKNIDKIEL